MGLSKKGRYVRCTDCGCRLEMNGVCKICGHVDNPLLAGMVPDLTGKTQPEAVALLSGPEAQLVLGNVTTGHSDIVGIDHVISSTPGAGTQLTIGSSVDIVLSLGPEN